MRGGNLSKAEQREGAPERKKGVFLQTPLQFENRRFAAGGEICRGGRVGRGKLSCHESGDRRFAGDTLALQTEI